jgi:hypothetical protein
MTAWLEKNELLGERAVPQTCPSSSVTVGARDALAMHWVLRVAVVACFVGHGAFGIITKKAWVPYFAVWGLSEPWAWRLMPVVGTVDIAIGMLTLFVPLRAVLLWMVCWGLQTACLRPLSGEPVWELLERAGNFGVPLALLWSGGWPRSLREWFAPVRPSPLGPTQAMQIMWILRVTTAALLVGHGAFGACMHKPEWPGYMATVGVSPDTVSRLSLVEVVGWFEIASGLVILAWPWAGLLLVAFVWKLGTEWLRPLAGEPLWEFIERGGSYAAPLALLLLSRWPTCVKEWRHRRGGVVSRGLEKS